MAKTKKLHAYVVISKGHKYVQGAFPFTPEGKTKALLLLSKLQHSKKKEGFRIVIK